MTHCMRMAVAVLLLGTVDLAAADDAAADKPKLKPLTKPVKTLLVGKWSVKMAIDEKKAEILFGKQGATKEQIADLIKRAQTLLKTTSLTVEIKADGTSISVTRSSVQESKKHSKWKLVSAKGRRATLQITNEVKDGKPRVRRVKITVLDDDRFRLDDDLDLKDGAWKKPVFERVKKKNESAPR